MARKIKVLMGELTKPLIARTVVAGTTLGDFLKEQNLTYSSSVRVNGKTARSGEKLHADDVITIMEAVSGGV